MKKSLLFAVPLVLALVAAVVVVLAISRSSGGESSLTWEQALAQECSNHEQIETDSISGVQYDRYSCVSSKGPATLSVFQSQADKERELADPGQRPWTWHQPR